MTLKVISMGRLELEMQWPHDWATATNLAEDRFGGLWDLGALWSDKEKPPHDSLR